MLQIGAVAWAMIGLAIASTSLGLVNADARVLIGVASVTFPACALLAALALAYGRGRLAGILLLLSAATPTYFAWVAGLPALLVGLALLLAPGSR